jgi:hypothetical protein
MCDDGFKQLASNAASAPFGFNEYSPKHCFMSDLSKRLAP